MNKIEGHASLTKAEIGMYLCCACWSAAFAIIMIGVLHPAFQKFYPAHNEQMRCCGHWHTIHVPAHMGTDMTKLRIALWSAAGAVVLGVALLGICANLEEARKLDETPKPHRRVEVRQAPKHSAQNWENEGLHSL